MDPFPVHTKSHFVLAKGWKKLLENLVMVFFSSPFKFDFLILFQKDLYQVKYFK